MRRFEIIDGAKRNSLPCAVLNWENNNNEKPVLSIDIYEHAGTLDVPMLFVPFVRENKRHIGNKWTKRWIEERVVPPSRQNLGEVLRANNLEFYDSLALFIAASGKCEQDDFFISEIKPAGDCETSAKPAKKLAAQQIGMAIKAARTDAKMTQCELAQAAKITQSALSCLENGRGNPTLNLLEDVARALGKTIDVRLISQKPETGCFPN